MCNFLVLFSVISLLMACHISKPASKKVQFSSIIDTYFLPYNPYVKPSIMQPENSLAEVVITKKKMSKNEMKQIKIKLKQDGWKEVEYSENYSFYCLNKNQAIGILFPEKFNEVDKNNVPIDYSDINSWSIVLYYQSFGIDGCY